MEGIYMRESKEDKKIVIITDKDKYKKYKYIDDDKTIYIHTEGKSDAEYLRKIFANNLNYYMTRKGKSRNDLKTDLKLKYSTIRDWTNGAKYPRPETIQLLADYFNILQSDLTEKKKNNKIPVVGKIPAGIPIEAIEEILDYEEIPQNWLTGDKDYFALRIDGRSMYPMYCPRRYCYF